MDLKEEAKKRYEELLKQKEEIDNELTGLKKYLEAVGILTKQQRKRRKKQEH